VAGIIQRFAPASENNTFGYIQCVCRSLGVRPAERLPMDLPSILIELAQSIVHHENGVPPSGAPAFWYDDSVYAEAATSALASEKGHEK
jgi:hypothetical protein